MNGVIFLLRAHFFALWLLKIHLTIISREEIYKSTKQAAFATAGQA